MFKSKRRDRSYRVKRGHDEVDGECADVDGDTATTGETAADDSAGVDESDILAKARLAQRFRRKAQGVSTVGLAVGERLDEVTELVAEDPYKLATGGLVDMKQLNAAPQKSAAVIGTEFSHETKTVDDDKHMMRYIEEEMAKRKGKSVEESTAPGTAAPDGGLFELPEHLKKMKGGLVSTEETVSSQLLTSIPEVDLGVESRMATVEQTEKAKAALAAVMATRRAAGGRGGRGSDDATYARARFHLPREMRDNVGLATDAKALEHFHKKIKR